VKKEYYGSNGDDIDRPRAKQIKKKLKIRRKKSDDWKVYTRKGSIEISSYSGRTFRKKEKKIIWKLGNENKTNKQFRLNKKASECVEAQRIIVTTPGWKKRWELVRKKYKQKTPVAKKKLKEPILHLGRDWKKK
jgi:hypothetical protein